MHTKDQGSVGEALVIAQVIEAGCAAFPEFGDNSKIDLIVEDRNGQLHKVQVKTVDRDVRSPNVSKLYLRKFAKNYTFKYSDKMIDWFALIDFKTKKIAWIKAKDILSARQYQLMLRHEKTKNGQSKNVKYFDDYTKCPFE